MLWIDDEIKRERWVCSMVASQRFLTPATSTNSIRTMNLTSQLESATNIDCFDCFDLKTSRQPRRALHLSVTIPTRQPS